MSIDEPTFTYDASRHDLECLTRRTDETRLQNAEANRKAREEAAMDAIQRAQIRQAQEQATREHMWEHKQPDPRLGQAMGSFAGFRAVGRTFTREEVLTAIAAYKATWDLSANTERTRAADQALSELAGIFKRME